MLRDSSRDESLGIVISFIIGGTIAIYAGFGYFVALRQLWPNHKTVVLAVAAVVAIILTACLVRRLIQRLKNHKLVVMLLECYHEAPIFIKFLTWVCPVMLVWACGSVFYKVVIKTLMGK